ncbi:MAG: hypothetical protein LQ340_003387 [Diploschistes diacapsis]|nr:MAG: hypothetical protein LQ340_003387 [Diploschistes diacapsis]
MAAEERQPKLCFVTIGATASFDSLIEAVLDIRFIQTLRDARYSELRVQHGKQGKLMFDEFVKTHRRGRHSTGDELIEGVVVGGFDYKRRGLAEDMRQAKGGIDGHVEGVVISHAGTGSILDAFRANVPLIVVPNTGLLDNHQQELADELARQRYVVVGRTGGLSASVLEIEEQRRHRKPWLPLNHRDGLTPSKRLMAVLDEEMGFVD